MTRARNQDTSFRNTFLFKFRGTKTMTKFKWFLTTKAQSYPTAVCPCEICVARKVTYAGFSEYFQYSLQSSVHQCSVCNHHQDQATCLLEVTVSRRCASLHLIIIKNKSQNCISIYPVIHTPRKDNMKKSLECSTTKNELTILHSK